MYNHKPRWGFGKSRAEWRMQRPLFARTISDALGRYWQEGEKRTGGGQNMRKATSSSEWEEKIEVLAVLIGSVHMSVCSELSWKRKGGGCLCLFSIILVCLFVFLCFVYCKYACCCLIFSWFISISTKLCPFPVCLFYFFFKKGMIVQLVTSWSKSSKISFSNDVSEFSPSAVSKVWAPCWLLININVQRTVIRKRGKMQLKQKTNPAPAHYGPILQLTREGILRSKIS